MGETASETEAITGLLQAWTAGVRARDIVEAVARHHTSELLMFDVVGPLQVIGLAEYRRTWAEQFFPWHGGTGQFDLRDVRVHAGQDIAFATALIDCAGTEDGVRVRFTLRLTDGLERRPVGWTVVHEHHSEPLPFDDAHIGGGVG